MNSYKRAALLTAILEKSLQVGAGLHTTKASSINVGSARSGLNSLLGGFRSNAKGAFRDYVEGTISPSVAKAREVIIDMGEAAKPGRTPNGGGRVFPRNPWKAPQGPAPDARVSRMFDTLYQEPGFWGSLTPNQRVGAVDAMLLSAAIPSAAVAGVGIPLAHANAKRGVERGDS